MCAACACSGSTGEGVRPFQVFRVLAHRGTALKRSFLVHWAGRSLEDATWEREGDLPRDCAAVREYVRRVLTQPLSDRNLRSNERRCGGGDPGAALVGILGSSSSSAITR